ncbi:hypothetical protein SmJEL517_g02383 [Synchytrium microbalum]|uniref:Pseudouridine synthase RsuA/RluA-like domain-containing protein n=1 Tax=Synchytrium microbalum TaxID=1806994 RepID=A0A507CAU8_9FUNG|nr:uncharacterized protein SmJEL517_g02383 [Synchytrium microbalum]TPX35136.1 hypothetical protein SmJEL517_g02383 [Synchytrium microbalum]
MSGPMYIKSKQLTVGDEFHNQPLLGFLMASSLHFSKNVARWKVIKAEVTIDRSGKTFTASADTKVSTGDVVNVMMDSSPYKLVGRTSRSASEKRDGINEQIAATLEKLQNSVLYRDADILAINKPHGLPVQGGSKVWIHVDRFLPDLKFDSENVPKIVHRIDRDTAGVVLLARNDATAARLSDLFRNSENRLEKTYWGILVGRVPGVPSSSSESNPTKEIVTGITEVKERGRDYMAVCPAPNELINDGQLDHESKTAVTRYEIVATTPNASMIHFHPITGKKHQIRVHAASVLRASVVGDYKYGNGVSDRLKPLFRDPKTIPLHLHLREITLKNWFGPNAHLKITAPVPKYFEQTMRLLGFDRR